MTLGNGAWTGQRARLARPASLGPLVSQAIPAAPVGLWDAAAAYRAMDVVAFNGSEWRAVCDDPGPLPGDGWRLGAKGSRGKPGERGETGPPGPQGVPGVGIVEAVVADFELILMRSDGTALTCNLLPVFERYHREVAA